MNLRRLRALAVAALLALPIVLAAPASADECPPLDIDCVVGEVVEEGGGVLEETVETVEETAGEVTEPVLGGTPADPGGTPGAGQDEPAGDGDPGNRDERRRDRDRRAGTPGGAAASRTAVRAGAEPAAASTPATIPFDPAQTVTDEPALRQRLAAAGAGAVKSLAAVLLLMIGAGVFVLIQNRLDRKDPRLALAPTRSDVVRFT